MAEVNRAYAAGDAERLQTLFKEWQTSPESIQGDDLNSELQRTLRKIEQSHQRLQSIEEQIQNLEMTDLYQLLKKQEKVEKLGQSLLNEMASQLERQIQVAQKRLQKLKEQIQ